MWSAPYARDKIKVAYVVVSTNHVTFRTNKFPRLISLPTSAFFVSGTSGITAILKKKECKSYTLNHLMVRLQSWKFGQCGVPIHCYYYQVHSDAEW